MTKYLCWDIDLDNHENAETFEAAGYVRAAEEFARKYDTGEDYADVWVREPGGDTWCVRVTFNRITTCTSRTIRIIDPKDGNW